MTGRIRSPENRLQQQSIQLFFLLILWFIFQQLVGQQLARNASTNASRRIPVIFSIPHFSLYVEIVKSASVLHTCVRNLYVVLIEFILIFVNFRSRLVQNGGTFLLQRRTDLVYWSYCLDQFSFFFTKRFSLSSLG